ncbi:phage terminase large subunit family protein [Mesorhizobium sp. CA13]|uniref:phage terminase large subunit family protein n=1 Tax=Mesorhizobium sp. CA13 TaxID=2876643 RepID=UPI001CCD8F6E|nr:terminase gpA endonuclease subunit [Mesorhizobium sp. CA13]MBZ9852808.1 phage terminase large subunit family protein [Mesorhizobium sp. CA13]
MSFHDRHLANAEASLYQVLGSIFAPPPPVDYLRWAKRNIVFSERITARPGPYSEETFPFFSEILTALGPDDPCQIVTLQKSAQVGGTVAANIFTLGTMDMDPCDLLYVHPTDSNAIKWSNQKLVPLLKETTCLAPLFPLTSREGSNSKLYKERKDGRGAISAAGANSPSNLSMVSPKRQVQDDLAKWENNQAGDPEAQADSRSKAFLARKVLKISTPLVSPGCRITANYEAGSQERYHVPCPHCGHLQSLEWEAMRDHIDPTHPEKAAFLCVAEGCGGFIEEHHRAEICRPVHLGGKARWIAKYPERKRHHRSFFLWVPYSPLESWEALARAYLNVRAGGSDEQKRDQEAEQVFWNDWLGLAYEATGETLPWEDLRDRAEEIGHRKGVIPKGALTLTIGVDVQGDRVEWHLVGWGARRQRWTIDYGVFDAQTVPPGGKPHSGHISEPEIRTALDNLLKREWPDFLGNRRAADLLAIDGNAWTADVWEWAKRHPLSRVIMTRGVPNETASLLAMVKKERDSKGRVVKYSRKFFNLAVSILKMGLYRGLKKQDPDEVGYVHLPKGLPDDFFRQLVSERRLQEKSRSGIVSWRWLLPDGLRNEVLDTMNIAEGAAIRLGVRQRTDDEWETLAATIEVPPTEAQLDLEEFTPLPLFEPAAIPATEKPTGLSVADLMKQLNR